MTVDCRALVDYDRTGRRYCLTSDSYKILVAYVESTLPPALPSTSVVPPVPQDPSVRHHSAPFLFSSTVAQSIVRDLQKLRQPTAAQTPIRRSTDPVQPKPAAVPSVSKGPAPVLFHVPQYTIFPTRPVSVGRESYQGRRIYGKRPLNERVPLLPHAHPLTRRPVYHPYAKLSALLLTLIFFVLVAYGGYRWSVRGNSV